MITAVRNFVRRKRARTTAVVPAPTDVEWGRCGLVAASATGNVYAVPRGLFGSSL